MGQKQSNIYINLVKQVGSYSILAAKNIQGLFSGKQGKNTDGYGTLSYLLKDGPKEWAKHPTGIGLGRTFILAILYFFRKHVYFSREK